MSKVEALKAELAYEEAAEAFLEAKAAHQAGDLSFDEWRAVKDEFHSLRVAYRAARDANA